MEIYTEGKPSGNLASREQIRSLRDIKETLERNTAESRSQTEVLTKLIEIVTAVSTSVVASGGQKAQGEISF